jgi:hypothetical protein
MDERRIEQIEARRREVADAMLAIGSMCQGALSEQYLKAPGKGKEEQAQYGPYFVLSRWEQGKNRSRRIRADEVGEVKRDLANYQTFTRLCEEFASLTEELGRLKREQPGLDAASKKKSRSHSKRTRK